MRRSRSLSMVLILVMLLCASCSTTRRARRFNDLTTPYGDPIAHQSTTNVGINLGIFMRVIGNATLEATMHEFTQKAKLAGASQIRITDTSSSNWWFILPPLSFLFTPVSYSVTGDIFP